MTVTINGTTGIASPGGDTSTSLTTGTLTATNITTTGETGSLNSINTFGFKNRLINGAQIIDQRNAGASVAVSNATLTYITDRWGVYENCSGAFSWQQVSDAPSNFINSLKCTVTTANSSPSNGDLVLMRQPIEGLNVADLGWGTASAKTVTLSFWVKSSLTGQFGGSFSNSDVTRSYPFSYTISAANTWEQKTITVAGDTTGTWLKTNGIGVYVFFDMGCGSTILGTAGAWAGADYRGATGDTKLIATLSATWQVTGVQLEVGSQATSFDFRSYGTELALCQRYYYRLKTATAYGTAGSGRAYSTSNGQAVMMAPVSMRAAPSASYSSLSNWDSSGVAPIVAMNPISEYSADYRVFTINIQATTFGAGQSVILNSNNNIGSWIDWSAEL